MSTWDEILITTFIIIVTREKTFFPGSKLLFPGL